MASATNKPIILVDGSSYLYRAYHSPPHLTNSKGEATGAVYGVINMLKSLLRQYQPECIAVVFDASGKTFRDEMYEQYKANRPAMPDDLRSQIKPLHAAIKAMGLPLLCEQGVEADDVIGSLATAAAKAGHDVLISTGDKDMAQLVSERITLVDTMKGVTMDPQGVVDKFGVPPELIIDLLALMGDKSDNIPGVPGVGTKTAVAMLQGIGSLKTMYEDLDKLTELSVRGAKSLPKKMAENRELAELSYQLATIKTDLELDSSLSALKRHEPDLPRLAELYSELEFRRWLSEILEQGSEAPEAATSDDNAEQAMVIDRTAYQTVLNEQDWQQVVQALRDSSCFAIDTETTSLDAMQAELVGICLAWQPGQAVYVPVGHDYEGAPEQLSLEQVLADLKPLLDSEQWVKVGQNLKYDSKVLRRYGIELEHALEDTMLESYAYNSVSGRHDMDTLALTYLGHKTVSFEDIAGKGAKQLTFNQIALEQASEYAAEDADVTLRLHDVLTAHLHEDDKLNRVYRDIELPLVPVLSRMESNGVLIDKQALADLSYDLNQRLEALTEQAYSAAGEEFNLGSPKQLQAILFDKLGLPVLKKTPKGAPSTAEDVLQDLALDYPLPKLILEHRGLAKLKSTYADKLPKMINPHTGRVHTSYHQAVTATGRLSSTDPNLQNIPIRTEQGRRVRQAFIAPKGRIIMAADYSQIELRIMAHLSGDQGLLTAFAENKDIHSATASEVFGVPLADVSKNQRRSAKAINFGLIYGMSAFGLSKQLSIPRGDAQHYMDTYFHRYPGVKEYMERTRQFAEEHGYVETLFGRRLQLPEIHARNRNVRAGAERAAINAPMQGTAADIIKKAMVKVDDWIRAHMPAQVTMLMQVHDELVFEVDEAVIDEVESQVVSIMEQAAELNVPLLVEAGRGPNWDDAH